MKWMDMYRNRDHQKPGDIARSIQLLLDVRPDFDDPALGLSADPAAIAKFDALLEELYAQCRNSPHDEDRAFIEELDRNRSRLPEPSRD